jgi:hypothetical protein
MRQRRRAAIHQRLSNVEEIANTQDNIMQHMATSLDPEEWYSIILEHTVRSAVEHQKYHGQTFKSPEKETRHILGASINGAMVTLPSFTQIVFTDSILGNLASSPIPHQLDILHQSLRNAEIDQQALRFSKAVANRKQVFPFHHVTSICCSVISITLFAF